MKDMGSDTYLAACHGFCSVPGTFEEHCLDAMWKEAGCSSDVVAAHDIYHNRAGRTFEDQKKEWNKYERAEVAKDMKAWANDADESRKATCHGSCTVPGTFEKDCLQEMWKESGCATDIMEAVKVNNLRVKGSPAFARLQQKWNSNRRRLVLMDMKKWTTATDQDSIIFCRGWCNEPGSYDNYCLQSIWERSGCWTDVVTAFTDKEGSFDRQKACGTE